MFDKIINIVKISKLKNYAIILASGTGSRFGSNLPKQFAKLYGKTILEYSVDAFENNKLIDNIIIVITPEYKKRAEKIINKNNYKKISAVINGGEQRKDSSYLGISSITEKEANVLIHDCARPLVSQRIINDCINALKEYEAVGVAIPSTDTIIYTENKFIKNIPNRSSLMRIQTPQCFKLSLIKKAHELSENNKDFTDDCGLIIKHKLANIYVVDGETDNIKITYPDDISLAKLILKKKKSAF